MSNPYLNGAWNTTTPSLASKLVLVRLADRADDHTGIAWPAVSSIAKDCGMSRKGVQKALRQLEAAGLIKEVPGPHASKDYKLLTPRELYSRRERTTFASPANPVRPPCEPRSPKPSVTQIDPSKEPARILSQSDSDDDYKERQGRARQAFERSKHSK